MAEPPQPPQPPSRQEFNLTSTPETQAGVHADFATVWHYNYGFVLDFAALVGPPTIMEDEAGAKVGQINAFHVARIRIPPQQVWEIMKALENQLSQWERETGQRPHDPGR